MRVTALFMLVLAAVGCGDDAPVGGAALGGSGAGGDGSVSGGSTGDLGGAAESCGTANQEPLDSFAALTWDDGVPGTNLREQTFQITADNKTFTLNEEPLYEAVRFDLEHPARVAGFSIHWAALPDDPMVALEAGLYRDFGHNGFDFWAPEPLFTGTRCVGDVDGDGWLSYAFDEAIVLPHPGLVYVAHRAEPGSPVWSFDDSQAGDGSCALFDDCHSALNLPDALAASYYNGLSFPFQYDYLVRLHYEYLEEIQPAERLFQPVDFSSTAHASFGDYDADGDDDIVTDGPKLWQNQGDGSFVDVSLDAGLVAAAVSGTGGVFGDYDNDGCLDLFIYAESYTVADTLLHSDCSGGFVDVTAAAGIVDLQTYETCNDPANVRSPTAAAAWVDLDADGLLDLYLANFICWDKGTTYVDTVWHNLGAGVFEDWTGAHGFGSLKHASRGANPIDVEGDGDVDVLVNNYRLEANQYWENLGGAVFDETAPDHGIAGSPTQGYYGHTIGTAFGDLDEDGDFDLVSANLAHPRFFDFSDKTEVLMQGADGVFEDIQGDWLTPDSATGLRYQETHSVPALADFDLDGHLDLVITAVYDGRPTDFYWGNGDGTFELDAYHAGVTTKNGWGVAVADIDLDGDSDIFDGVPFTNEIPSQGHFFQLRVVGNVSANRAAIGSTVTVSAGGKTLVRQVQGGTGKGGQDSLYLSFGLADTTSVDGIVVRFPGGAETTFDGPFAADQRIWIYEDGTVVPGWTGTP